VLALVHHVSMFPLISASAFDIAGWKIEWKIRSIISDMYSRFKVRKDISRNAPIRERVHARYLKVKSGVYRRIKIVYFY
jgi:hypothetical protein